MRPSRRLDLQPAKPSFSKGSAMPTQLRYETTITCPECGHRMREEIPDNY